MMIKNGPIIFPDPVRHKIYMSNELKDLISKLLDRNAATRLGTKGDFQEVVSHPFFKDVNFEKLTNKEIEPPYKPSLELMTSKEGEVSVGDPELKEIKTEDDQDDIPQDKKMLIEMNQKKFKDF